MLRTNNLLGTEMIQTSFESQIAETSVLSAAAHCTDQALWKGHSGVRTRKFLNSWHHISLYILAVSSPKSFAPCKRADVGHNVLSLVELTDNLQSPLPLQRNNPTSTPVALLELMALMKRAAEYKNRRKSSLSLLVMNRIWVLSWIVSV